jgi:glycosyltransferase involved in cell wall biosynthesis
MDKTAVSVIVPVYRSEAYLGSCIDSILRQTLSRLEVILVDDGSPDGCGAICDRYAARDSRVKVIHQPNGGVAKARNAGLDAATGDWIAWVDSDDFIEPDMFQRMLEAAVESRADVCVCGRFEERPGSTGFFGFPRKVLLDQKGAIRALLESRVLDDALYDKLWNRRLFADIRFPEGKTYEDLATVYRLLLKVRRVLCLPEPKYHYRHRKGSIMSDTSLPNRMNHYEFARQRYADLIGQFPEFEALLEERCLAAAVGIWCGYCHNPRPLRREYAAQLHEIAAYAKPRLHQALTHTSAGMAGRLVLRLLPYDRLWAFHLARFIGWLYQCKHGRTL